MRMTPFAPREPYTDVDPASRSTSMDLMSLGLRSANAPPGTFRWGTPSMTYSGSWSELSDRLPRMRIETPPDASRRTSTPGNRPSIMSATDVGELRRATSPSMDHTAVVTSRREAAPDPPLPGQGARAGGGAGGRRATRARQTGTHANR